MLEHMRARSREYIQHRPKVKKTIGVIFILAGLFALITPLTPGSWFAFVGLELLGVRVLLPASFRRLLTAAKRLKFSERK